MAFDDKPAPDVYSAYPAYPGDAHMDAMVSAESEWRRLDARTVLTYPFAQGGPIVVVLIIAVAAGGPVEGLLVRLGVTVGVLLIFATLHWWRFRYRVLDGRLETRSGLLARRSKVINVDRIRGVDIEAKLAHRLAGVCALRIEHPGASGGSRGRNRDARDRIDAVSHAEADRLRAVLLHERAIATAPHNLSGSGGDGVAVDAAVDSGRAGERTLLRMPLAWLLYAPFSLRMLTFGPVTLIAVTNGLSEAHVDSDRVLVHWTDGTQWPLLVLVVVVALVLTAVLSAVLSCWRWTVTARGTDVVLTRGLLTRRTVALERRRMRGVVLREPLAGRPVRAATLQAVLSGLTGNVRSALVPLGPAPTLSDFGAQFVRPCSAAMITHPRGAFRRRLRRCLAPAVALAIGAAATAAFSTLVALGLAGGAALAAALGGAWAVQSYRTLGHAMDERVLASRHGVLVRHTETVARDSPIGLRVRQSVFAQRAGVASVDVALVARGFTRVPDMAAEDVADLAVRLLPELRTVLAASPTERATS